MLRKFAVITIGGATKDIVFETGEGEIIANPKDLTRQKLLAFEYGAKILSEGVFVGYGGGGSNAALSLAKLGLKVGACLRVGRDHDAEEIISRLRKARVNLRFIQKDPSKITGFSFLVISTKTKDHLAFLCRMANDNLKVEKLEPAEWFYLSSLTGQNWSRNSSAVLKLILKNKTKLAWNPGETQLKAGRRGLNPLLKKTDLLILNKDEAIELVLSDRGKFKKINEVASLLKIIKSWIPGIVAISQGGKGASAFDGQKIYHEPATKKKVADTTGAGDAFGSSLLAGLIFYRNNLKKALKFAIINSGSVVSVRGAQNGLLTRKEIEKIL